MLRIPTGRRQTSWLFTNELVATEKQIPVVVRAGLEPGTAGLRVRRADHSARCLRNKISTIKDKSLGTLACQGNLSVRPPLPSSLLFTVMNSSLLVSNIVGGKRVPYSSDAISCCFQNSLSTHVPVILPRRAKDFCRGL